MNISPESKKLYKGTKIGEFILRNHINFVQDCESDISPPAFEYAYVDLAHCDLPPCEKGQLIEPELATVITLLKEKKALHGTAIAPGLRRSFLKDGILCREYVDSSSNTKHIQLVVPSDLHEVILKHLHIFSGHLGLRKTMERVKIRYYWPEYENDIEKWIHECDECQRHYPPPRKAPLGTIKAHYPFEMVAWDIMVPLPVSKRGHQYILIVTDVFTKWVEAFPLCDTVSAMLAEILVDEVICHYGVPKNIPSDQGANFCSSVIQIVCNLLKID